MLKQSIKQYRNIKGKYYIYATADLDVMLLLKKECNLLGVSYRMIEGQLFIQKKMNNNTKPANIMTWQTFKKKFKLTVYCRFDGVFGKVTVEPTMVMNGFKRMNIQDIDELYNYKPPKPIDIVKDQIDIFKYSYVIYYVWKHRDFHGTSIDIFYK